MGKNNFTVSVIIPTYNRAHLLGRSIRSIMNQTYQNFEIIVVDDGSTDNTDELIFSLVNEKIRYIRHEKNKGAAAARNTGIKAAKGDYIAFQDSDDIWLPEKLEKQMEVFKTAPKKVGVVYTGFYRIIGSKRIYMPYSWVNKKDGDIYPQILAGNFVTTQSITVRAGCLEKVGLFDENLPRLQDWEFVIRLSKHYSFEFIDEPLLYSYYTQGCISSDKEALVSALKLIIEKHYIEFKNNKTFLASRYLTLGSALNSCGDFNNARHYFIKAVKTYPFDKRLLLHTILSFFGKGIYNKVMKNYHTIKSHFD